MFQQLKIGNILFLDIETVPLWPAYEDVPEPQRQLWEKKSAYLRKETETPGNIYQRAGIYAEFGRIICISTGMVVTQDDRRVLRLKSFFDENERDLLSSFSDLIIRLCERRKDIELCAHNGKEFDFPYIARRMLVNNVQLPDIFCVAGKRPWEVKHIDTLELWKFGDHKHYTSLDLLANIFQIQSPKADIDGSQVARVYWHDKDIMRIVKYCRNDVITTVRLLLKFKGEPSLEDEDIVILDPK